jgi:hypothetical protein
MSKPLNWPSREEWAYRRQHPYWDSDTGCPFADKYGHRLSDYASAEEIAVLIAALKNLYRDKGCEMRIAKLQANERGLGNFSSYREWRHLPDEEKEVISRPLELKCERQVINKALADIRDNAIPDSCWQCKQAEELLRPFHERYDDAFKAAHEQWKRECEQKISIDDAAWEEELQRRTDCEARRRA